VSRSLLLHHSPQRDRRHADHEDAGAQAITFHGREFAHASGPDPSCAPTARYGTRVIGIEPRFIKSVRVIALGPLKTYLSVAPGGLDAGSDE